MVASSRRECGGSRRGGSRLGGFASQERLQRRPCRRRSEASCLDTHSGCPNIIEVTPKKPVFPYSYSILQFTKMQMSHSVGEVYGTAQFVLCRQIQKLFNFLFIHPSRIFTTIANFGKLFEVRQKIYGTPFHIRNNVQRTKYA